MSWGNIYRKYGELVDRKLEQPRGQPLMDFISYHYPEEMPDELDKLTVQALGAMAEYDASTAYAGILGMGISSAARSAMLVASLLHSAYLVGKRGESQQQDEQQGEQLDEQPDSEEAGWGQAFEELLRLREFQAEFEEEFPDVDLEMGKSVCRLRLFMETNYNKQVCTEHHSAVNKAFDAVFDYLVQGVTHSDPSDLAENPFLQVTWHLAGAIFSSGFEKGRAGK